MDVRLEFVSAWFLYFSLVGLSIFGYGFNNIPLIRPIPLVDVLVLCGTIFTFSKWFRLLRVNFFRNLAICLMVLDLVICGRLIFDFPKYGLLSLRDAIFALELWAIFPFVYLGYLGGRKRVYLFINLLFIISTVWFSFYMFRAQIVKLSPIVGLQKNVPLFSFINTGILLIPIFFWFITKYRRNFFYVIFSGLSIFIMLLIQSRGVYLSFLLALLGILFFAGKKTKEYFIWVVVFLFLLGWLFPRFVGLRGRLKETIGIKTVFIQLRTIVGEKGPGAGTVGHRVKIWKALVKDVFSTWYGPLVGVGLGKDLFFTDSMKGIRKPHNDFLEIWARLGVVGFLPWFLFWVKIFLKTIILSKNRVEDFWIIALQISVLLRCLTQPGMAFAYTTVVWVGLTGLYFGLRIKG